MPNTNSDLNDVGGPLCLDSVASSRGEYLREIGPAGLVFVSRLALDPGTIIQLRIPLVQPLLECDGRIMWCESDNDHFVAGVKFLSRIDRFRARMIWQVYCIEQYRQRVREREGRELTRQEAAIEWIDRFATDFPKLDEFPEA